MENKLDEISHADNCMDLSFTADEVKVVNNLTELRTLKLFISFPEELILSKNRFSCFKRIKDLQITDKDLDKYSTLIYLSLEFFALSNPFLEENITQVFEKNGFYFIH